MSTAPTSCRLNERSGNLTLTAVAATAAGTVPTWDTPDDPAAGFQRVRHVSAARSWPRLVMLHSDAPCDVLLRWTGGGGLGGFCFVTMQRFTRVSIDATEVTVSALNRTNAANNFFFAIADGRQETRNAWVGEWAQAAPPTTGAIRIPPMTKGLRTVSNLGLASGASVRIRNAYGTVTGITPVTSAMVDPAVVVGVGDVQVIGLAAGEIVTLNFDLGV